MAIVALFGSPFATSAPLRRVTVALMRKEATRHSRLILPSVT
jgi:hypothetical protein